MYALFLVAALGHDDYAVREWSQAELSYLVKGWPWEYGPTVQRLAMQTASPEAYHRAQRPIALYRQWQVDSYVPSSVPVWPCCDMMPVPGLFGDSRCRSLAVRWYDCGEKAEYDAGPYWHRWRRATERMARSLIAAGESPAEVDRLLARMWALEQAANSDVGPRVWAESINWTRWQGGYPRPP